MTTRQHSTGWLLASGSLILTVLTGVAADIHVAPAGSNQSPFADWATAATDVKTAVDLANTYNNGSTVWISNGTYTIGAAITIDKNTRVRGYGGDRTAVVIDGGGAVRPFYLNHASAVLADLTVSNGYAAAASLSGHGGGVYQQIAGSLLTNCVVTHCTAQGHGGGVYILKGQAVHCLIIENDSLGTTLGTAGGIVVGADSKLLHSVVARNSAIGVHSAVGGIFLSTRAVVSNSTVFGNYGVRAGGAYANNAGVLTYSTFYDNIASNGTSPNNSYPSAGGIYSPDYGLLVRNCLIFNNAGWSGYRGAGGINANKRNDYTGTLNIEACTIWSNTYNRVGGSGLGGGGIFLTGTNYLAGCVVYGNASATGTMYGDMAITSSDRFTTNLCYNNGVGTSVYTLNPQHGNITANPLLTNPPSGDFTLTRLSPCVNTGTNLAWMTGAVDLAGNPRIDVYNGGRADMGAFEFTVGPKPGTTLIVR